MSPGSRPKGTCGVCNEPVWRPVLVGGYVVMCPPCHAILRRRWTSRRRPMQAWSEWLAEPADRPGDFPERIRQGARIRGQEAGIERRQERSAAAWDTDDEAVDIGISNTPKRRPKR
jgi:hypothetical protein